MDPPTTTADAWAALFLALSEPGPTLTARLY
jgi:hypothetical protein